MWWETETVCCFLIDSDEYGADINKVTIIERMLNVTRVPKTPPYIKVLLTCAGT